MERKTLAMLYLGISLYAFGGISFLQWKYYAIIIPFCIMLAISQDKKEY